MFWLGSLWFHSKNNTDWFQPVVWPKVGPLNFGETLQNQMLSFQNLEKLENSPNLLILASKVDVLTWFSLVPFKKPYWLVSTSSLAQSGTPELRQNLGKSNAFISEPVKVGKNGQICQFQHFWQFWGSFRATLRLQKYFFQHYPWHSTSWEEI